MRTTVVVRAGGSIIAAMLVVCMGCSRDATNTFGPLASPSPSANGKTSTDQHHVPTTFPTQQHLPFEAPTELKSENGLLETTFDVQPTTFNVAGAKVRGYAYQGQFMGPTLRVLPGDTVRIHLRDKLKEPTNLHSHGIYVSPIGISDNVLRVMKAGSNNDFVLDLPGDVEPGTYWYHTHLHGHVEEQVFAGLSGVLVVDGLIDRLPPQLQDVPDRVMALKDLQIKDGAIVRTNIDSSAPTTRTVNGQVDPVLTVQTNQTQLLRLANIGADIWYRLRLGGAQFHVIAEDANPVAEVWTADELVLPPGKRYDVLVRWPTPGSYVLETLPYSTGPDGDNYPQRRLATFDASGDKIADVAWPTSLGPVSPLETDHVDRTRHVVFSENPKTNKFYINGKQFDATHVTFVAKLGTTEEWVIKNTAREAHPFHIHVNDFEVMAVNGKPYHARSEQDVVALPPRGEVRIRMHFKHFVGTTVFHCHILAHEDNGMMGIVDISRSGRLSKATVKSLEEMNRAMPGHSASMGDGSHPGHAVEMPER
jgi:FtsP/CotA-like multicopper oxidase with cupredoxin domain